MMPQRLDLAPRAQRRIDLGLAAEAADVVLLVERQIMDAGLDGGGVALRAIGRGEFIAAPDRAVHDMHRAAGAGAELEYFRVGQALR